MDLRDVLRVLVRRFWVVAVVTMVAAAAMIAVRFYTKKDAYRASSTWIFKKTIYETGLGYIQEESPYPFAPPTIPLRITELTGDRALKLVEVELKNRNLPVVQPTLKPGPEEDSLVVSVMALTKEDALGIIIALAEIYHEYDRETLLEALTEAQKQHTRSLDVNDEKSAAYQAIEQRKTANETQLKALKKIGVFDSELELDILKSSITGLSRALSSSSQSLKQSSFKLNQLKSRRDQSTLVGIIQRLDIPFRIQEGPSIDTFALHEKMRGLRTELELLQRRYHDEYFKVREVRDRIAQLQQSILDVDSGPRIYDILVADEQIALMKATEKFHRELISTEKEKHKKLKRALKEIELEENPARELEKDVQEQRARLKEIDRRLELVRNLESIKVLREPRVVLATVQFETSTWVMIALVSLILGVASAYLLEYLNDTIRTVADVKTYMNLPTVGLIPEFKGVPHNLLEVAIKSPPYEYYNKLATFIEAALAEKQRKIMMITSAKEEEGKTSVCANLAIALAQSGRRVAIIDADMRKGQMHTIFSVDNAEGLSTSLALPADAAMPELLQTSVETLHLLPSGPVPVNPLMLLRGERTRKLLDHLEKDSNYDIVLMDTPPLMGVIDAAVLASHGIPTTLVIQDNVVRRAEINHVRANLMRVNADIMGVILNKSLIEPETYYYYYYRYRGYSG